MITRLIILLFVFLPILAYGQSVHLQNLEGEWKRNPKPEIAIQIAKEIIDEQTDKSLYYVKEAQKRAGADLQEDILALLTEIYLRKHRDQEARSFYEKLEQLYIQKGDTLHPKYLFIKTFWLALHSQSFEAAQILEKYLQPIQVSSVKDTEVAVLYLEYAANLMRIRNYSKSIEVLLMAEELYKRLDMQKHLGKLYNLRGLVYKNTNYYTLSIESYIKAIKTYRAYNPISRNLAVTYVNLGNIYMGRPKDTSLYKEAVKSFELGSQLCEEIKDTVQLIHFYERIGFLALLQKNTTKAKRYFEKGFDLAKAIGSAHLQSYQQLRLADAYFKSGQEADAIELLKKVLLKVEQDKNYELISEVNLYLAGFHQTLNKHREALTYIDNGINLSIKRKINLHKGLFYHNKIISLIAIGEWNEAQKANDSLLKIFKNDRNWYLKVYQTQRQIDSAMGNYKSALVWANKYQALKDSLDYAEKNQSFNEVQQRFISEEKEKENQLLRIQNEQAKANNQRNFYFIIVLGILSLLLLLAASNWWLKQKKLKIINQQIIAQEKQIRAFADQVAANNEILSKKNEFDSKLLAIISHDLRGPIHSVATLIEMMRNGMFKPEETNGLLELAHSSLYGAGQLLDNLLFWAKSYQSDFKVVIKEIRVKQVADEIIGLLALQAEQKGIFVENKIPADLICLAEEEALQLTLRNLVANAIKFTKLGGVTLEATTTTTHCQILVKDTGIGIAPENIKKVFDKSFHTKGTSKEKGNGLGLMLCKEFIERNKGTISVSSQVGEGSTFTITLPKATTQLAPELGKIEPSLVT